VLLIDQSHLVQILFTVLILIILPLLVVYAILGCFVMSFLIFINYAKTICWYKVIEINK
jgi:hypothetical protein